MGSHKHKLAHSHPTRFVIRGMESLDRIFMEYGDLAPAEDDSVVSVSRSRVPGAPVKILKP